MMEQLFTNAEFSGFAALRNGALLPDDLILRQILSEIKTNDEGSFTQIVVEHDSTMPEDSFCISAKGEKITLSSSNRRGEIYAATALLQQSQWNDIGELSLGRSYSQPQCSFRGLKLYLPAKDRLKEFFKIVNMLCYYRYNTIILEIGGAMEYRSHPEINETWVEYCKDMAASPNRANEVQTTYSWDKNSIHFENGGGEFLSQETVKSLIAYCRERGLEVIPEVPCLSHADYLLLSHPELAERSEDPYPDAYCPSNPESYRLLFEVMDEVIEVFQPSIMHIGHDEYYSIGICERCKDKSGADIYADDVNKISDYLRKKEISPIIWADKLLNGAINNSVAHGGAELYSRDENGETKLVRKSTFEAIEKMPKELIAYHWYWGIREDFDNDFHRHNIPIIYANFNSVAFPDWSRRLNAGALGAAPSHWSSVEEDTLQRNGVLLNIVFGAYMFWANEYRDSDYSWLLPKCFNELYLYKNRKNLPVSHFEIIHTTTILRPFVYLSSLPMQLEKDTIGCYIVEYHDGSVCEIPIVYGKNITNCERFWERGLRMKIEGHQGVGDNMEGYDSYTYDTLLTEVSYTTLPIKQDGCTCFKFTSENPFPNKQIISVTTKKSCEDKGDIILKCFSAV